MGIRGRAEALNTAPGRYGLGSSTGEEEEQAPLASLLEFRKTLGIRAGVRKERHKIRNLTTALCPAVETLECGGLSIGALGCLSPRSCGWVPQLTPIPVPPKGKGSCFGGSLII